MIEDDDRVEEPPCTALRDRVLIQAAIMELIQSLLYTEIERRAMSKEIHLTV